MRSPRSPYATARAVRRPVSHEICLAGCIALALAGPALANDRGEPRTLDTVVVTATGNQQWIKDAPASISVITHEEIERKPVTSIGQLLSTLPGVTGGYGLTGAQSKIKLRGLPEQYTLILIDGRRQGNSSGVNYRDDLGQQDLDWITPDMIERIEVVRGPMSSLYGSDAMGGVINIITRKINPEWGGSATFNYSEPDDSARGETVQLGANFSGPLTERLGLRVGGNRTDRASDKLARLTPGMDASNTNVLLNWNINDNHTIGLEGSYGEQKASGSGKFTPPPPGCVPKGWVTCEKTETLRAWGLAKLVHTGYGLSHDGRYSDATTSKINLTQNKYEDKGSAVDGWSKEAVFDASVSTGFKWGVEHALTVGGQWKREELFNEDTIGTVPVTWLGSGRISPKAEGDSWAVFAEDHLSLLDNLTLTLGVRYDETDNYDSNVSPRVYAVWHPSESWTLRGGVSQGYRAPNLKQATAGAATESRGGGCGSLVAENWGKPGAPLNATGKTGCFMAGNPNLEPETSTNYELGVAFDQDRWALSATYFFTDFKDKIEQVPLRDLPGFNSSYVNGYWWTVAQNIQKARTRGVEASFTIPLHERVLWSTNVTRMLESKNRTTGKDLLVVPKITANSSLDFAITDAWSVNVSAQHVGEQITAVALGGRSGPTFADAYTTYDISTRYDVNSNLTLRAGVRNLTDESTLEGGNNYDNGSRIYFVGLTTRF